ncbi:MAG TPA: TIGR03842 family LLM class F420-dependent oxidoreductase [Acidimicrobiia bacterium]|nr:TIGR03842 family LLM class F420-dependent oxidoreductase [Acidimicrobiia bacterium]
MEFGVVLQTNPPAQRVVELAQRAEELGFSYVWTFDSHVLWQEPFVIYSQILGATERIKVGPMVTNPGTRDWTVLASLFATLNDLFGPRTICGMGRGDSALRYIGLPPTTLETTARATRVIKDLVAGKTVEYNGKELNIPWIEAGWDLPVWMAAYGPKALASAGTHYDGFILQLADPQILAWTSGAVRQAAEAAGRRPTEVSVCVSAPAYVGSDLGHQRDQVRWFGGMVGNHVADLVTRYGTDESTVPRALTDFIKAREGYDYEHHGKTGNPSTDFVPDEVIDRFCVLGPAADHISRLQELSSLGVDQFAVYLMHDQMDETLEAYGAEIIPSLSAAW